jgi:alkane 1-monooxygenase
MTTGGMGTPVAHEFMHRKSRIERAKSIFLLAMINYSHFRIEHVYGHHLRVATPADPSSAQKNTTLYSHLPNAIVGGFVSAFRFEQHRLKKDKTDGYSFNRVYLYLLLSLIFSVIIALKFDLLTLAFWWGQSLLAICLIETINYIAHYGLLRKVVSEEKYERVRPHHSWDSDYSITNMGLFNLGKHPHHHSRASVGFMDLKNDQSSPKLPFGYPTAILVALCPPLWMHIMNAKLEQFLER